MESATASRPAPVRATIPGLHATLPLAVWAGLVAIAWVWGSAINDAGGEIALGAPPLYGYWDLRFSPAVALPVALAALAVGFGPALARSLRWRPLLWASFAVALAWSVALALTLGGGGLVDPLARLPEYLTGVPLINSPGEFLTGFTDRLEAYPTHVRSHPPGFVLAAWGLDEIGLGGSAPVSIAVVVIAASAVPAALVAARAVAGEDAARRAAPFLGLMPGAVWIATSADALYMGVGAWAVALTVLAIEARGRRAMLLALAGGLAFALCALLSYGLVLLGLVPTALALARRRLRPILTVARVVGAALLVVFLTTGFLWLDGFLATRAEYMESIARSRPYDYFLVNNLAAFAVIAGPALAVALKQARLTAAWALPLGALAAVAVADLSGMSKAEVERIWLPFLPWAVLATAALEPGRTTTALLTGQAALAIAIQVGVRTPW